MALLSGETKPLGESSSKFVKTEKKGKEERLKTAKTDKKSLSETIKQEPGTQPKRKGRTETSSIFILYDKEPPTASLKDSRATTDVSRETIIYFYFV